MRSNSMDYTKGGWKVTETPYARVVTDDGVGIANYYDSDFTKRPRFWQAKVNATLGAAAPEMYEALKDIIEQAEKTHLPIGADLADSIRVFGKQAIAKAEGKG